ncbi:MAG: phosphatase [Epsilonproteobacteria bacterium]|nr:phosphatase [Campylobacterota bacterium]
MVAIDLGSNTIRMIEYDCQTKQVIRTFEKIVRTADKLVETNQIQKESVYRIIEAINQAKEMMNFDEVVAYATQALRSASNQEEVIKLIKDATDVVFEVISPQEEAYFTAFGASVELQQPYKNMFLVDIGGASTELILKTKQDIVMDSFEVGIVTISQKYKSIEALEYGIKQDVKPFKDFINFILLAYNPDIFVASSGTPTTLAALKNGLTYETYDPSKINNTILTIEDLDYFKNKLLSMQMAQREKLVGVGRGDLIVSGIMIFREIFVLSGFEECVVVDSGVREGIALDYCQKKVSD